MEFSARLISYIIHPVFMPPLALIMLFRNEEVRSLSHPQYAQSILYLVLAVSALIVVSTMVMRANKIIRSLDIVEKRERIILYVMSVIWYGMLYIMVTKNDFVVGNVHPAVFTSLFGAIGAIILMIPITLKFKISAHMVAISGVAGAVAALGATTLIADKMLLVYLLILCGVVGTARMIVKAHSFQEVVAGFALGFLSTYIPTITGFFVEF